MKRVLALLLLLFSSATWSHAADPVTAVKVLLSKGWEKGGAKGKEAQDLLDHDMLNQPPLSTDPTAQAARWLALMQHDRYPDALKILETFPKLQPSDDLNLTALRATTWLRTIKQEYPQALIQADKLSQSATPNPPAQGGEHVQAQEEAITFLGNIAGYLEGPCAKSADQSARAKFEERLLQRLDEPRKKVFTDAKADTLAKFNKLTAELADAKSKSQQIAEEERQKALADLDGDLQKLSQDETKLQNQKMQVKTTFDKNIADLNRQDAPLQQNQVVLQGQIVTANANATQAQTTLQNLQLQLNNKNAPNRQQLQNDMQQANNNLQTARTLLNQFNNQAAVIVRQRKMIELQKIAADRSATAETIKIDKQLQGVDIDKKKIDRKIADLKKAKLGPPAKVLALETEVRALTTYNEFPLQQLRDTLLKKVQ